MITDPQPCTYGTCGARDTHPYAEGWRCDPHSPWARAGQPHPSSGRYCMAVCYCGGCLHRRAAPLAPITTNVIDDRRALKGHSVKSLAAYREAQAREQDRRNQRKESA